MKSKFVGERKAVKQLFNYSTVPGYEEAIRRTGKSLEEYLAMLGLDGIELLVPQRTVHASL